MRIVGLMIAKGDSKRLPGKNSLDFAGKPMFVWNLQKLLDIFEEVYFSSDNEDMLKIAQNMEAKSVVRRHDLCGDAPNILVYRHAMKQASRYDELDGLVAVQANSPTVEKRMIEEVYEHLINGYTEIKTCHSDFSDYGSIWGMTYRRLKEIKDMYNASPTIWKRDDSVDIHNSEDMARALIQHKKRYEN